MSVYTDEASKYKAETSHRLLRLPSWAGGKMVMPFTKQRGVTRKSWLLEGKMLRSVQPWRAS